jgi:hypothetical protein
MVAENITRATRSGPNPLPPEQMTSTERRAELCRLLALGLVRLHMRSREASELSSDAGESCLHFPSNQCRHATPTHRRPA